MLKIHEKSGFSFFSSGSVATTFVSCFVSICSKWPNQAIQNKQGKGGSKSFSQLSSKSQSYLRDSQIGVYPFQIKTKWLLTLLTLLSLLPAGFASFTTEASVKHITQPGEYVFGVHNMTFKLAKSSNGMVLYATDLEKTRSIVALSKVFDMTDLALANQNVKESLQFLSNEDQLHSTDGFYLIKDKEYIISDYKMTYLFCNHFCSSQNAVMINDTQDFFNIRENNTFPKIWIQIDIQMKNSDYFIFLGDREIFPSNTMGLSTPVHVFYYHKADGNTKEVTEIKFLYQYYDSQTQKYWQQGPYNVIAQIFFDATVHILIPEDTRYLVAKDYLANCACKREPTQLRRTFQSLTNTLMQVKDQQSLLKLGIEPHRLLNHDKAGDVITILNSEVLEMEQNTRRSKILRKAEIAPLSISTNDKLLQPMFYFVAKHIGAPMVISKVKPHLKKLLKKIGGKFMTYSSASIDTLTDNKLMSYGHTNFSLVIKIEHMQPYMMNVSSNILTTQKILELLQITNEQFLTHINQQAKQMLLQLAARQVGVIDHTVPVLVVPQYSPSFIFFDYYFTIINQHNTTTHYTLSSIPHEVMGNDNYKIKVPKVVNTLPARSGYIYQDFPETSSINKCLDQIFISKTFGILDYCQERQMDNRHLIPLLISDIVSLYVVISNDSPITIQCPHTARVMTTIRHDAGVLAIPPSCSISLDSEAGFIQFPPHNTLLTAYNLFQPQILFTYSLTQSTDYNFIIKIVLGSVTAVLGLFIVMLIGILWYVKKYKPLATYRHNSAFSISPPRVETEQAISTAVIE